MNSHPIKVAMVEPVGGHRGNEFYDFGLCKAVAEEGNSVTLYTCNETILDIDHPFPFEVKKFYNRIYGKAPVWLRGIRYVKGAFKTINHAVKNQKQLVHFHLYHFANREFLNFYLFRRKGLKVVATIHDVESFENFGENISKAKYKKFEKRIDHIIVHSSFALESVKHYLPDFPKEKIHIVPHGDSDFLYRADCSKEEARKKLNLPLDKKLVLFFGQIKKVKGVDVLLKSFSKVREKISDAKLLIVGSPWKTDLSGVEEIISRENIANDCVLNFNYIENEQIPYYYKAADIVVLPYRKIYSSGVMVRSLDYGAAIIASDLDTFKQIIIHGENGLLFQNENDSDLAEKIIYLLQNPSLAETIKVNAKKTADEKFSWKIIGKQVNDIYKLALNEE